MALAAVLAAPGCASNWPFSQGCIMTCSGPPSSRPAAPGWSPPSESSQFEPLRPTLQVGDRTSMCFGSRERQDGAHRGYWRSGDTRIIRVRSLSGKANPTCAEVEAVAPGDVVVFFRFQGGLMDWSNEVHVE